MYIAHQFETLVQYVHEAFQLCDFVVKNECSPSGNVTSVVRRRRIGYTCQKLVDVLYSIYNVPRRRFERFIVALECNAGRFDGL